MVGSYLPTRDDAWEECLRIYLDASSEIALARANRDAAADQIEYETSDGYKLSWRVHSVRLVREAEAHALDGEEVFSRSLTCAEAQSLMTKR